MSLLGDKIAVLSFGMSCQTAYQLESAAGLISALAGDVLHPVGIPFDWLICPLQRVAAMLGAGLFFPADPAQLAVNQKPWWPAAGIYFWHHLLGPDHLPDVQGTFAETKSKFLHMTETLHSAKTRKRIIVFVSNTQNNLWWICRDFGLLRRFEAADVVALQRAGNSFFGREIEYVVVSYPDLVDDLSGLAGVALYTIEPDDSEWAGSSEQWAALLSDYLAALR